MNYIEKSKTLNNLFESPEKGSHEGLKFLKIGFTSGYKFSDVFEEEGRDHNYDALLQYFLKQNEYSRKYIFRHLNAPDSSFTENCNFNYYVIKAHDNQPANSAILLLHGLNERNWSKYVSWAHELALVTGKAVIMFPLAFHMDRAPVEWGNSRIMNKVAQERMKLYPDVQFTSFANAALSTRLQFAPERLLLSGIQTYNDIVKLLNEIKSGMNEHFTCDTKIDLFGYSIGAFLGEILLTSNPENLFDNSRMLMFCGGAVLDKATPVSKAIIDSEAARTVLNYYGKENFENEKSTEISRVMKSIEDVGVYFKSLINSFVYPSLTRSLLNSIKDRIKVIGLKKDKVFSEEGLKGTFANGLSSVVEIFDFDYSYTHEKPFPENEQIANEVETAFKITFASAGTFLA